MSRDRRPPTGSSGRWGMTFSENGAALFKIMLWRTDQMRTELVENATAADS